MNYEKQDIFYSQARNVLNYSVKRLWFKINPFLETKSKNEHDLPNKFIQPQQSTVLCEKLSFSGHIDRREQGVPVGEFWDFLYSDKWDHACSIRILEGQLYDYIQTKLNVLLRKQAIVQHRTFAYAKNKREKRGCYKPANEKGCGEIEEVLLLEFIYYGCKVEPVRPYGSTCSSYPGTSTTTSGFTPRRSPPNSDTEEDYFPLIRRVSLEGRAWSRALPRVNSTVASNRTAPKAGKASGVRKRSNSPEREKYGNKEVKTVNQLFEIIPKQISTDSSESDYRTQPPALNLKQFRCTEKIVYGDNLDVISEEIELAEEDLGFGEELYLSDNVREPRAHNAAQYKSVVKKLAACKVELQKLKEEKRKQEKALADRPATCLPPMPSFDIDKIRLDNVPGKPMFKFKFLLQEVPSFERLITILESEDRYDPRYRCSKQMNRKVANRYNLTKEALHQRTLETAELNTNIKKRMDMLKKIQGGSGGGKRDIKDAKSNMSSVAAANPKQDKPVITTIINLDDVVGLMAAKVRGVTDSKECGNYVLNNMGKKKGSKDRKRSKVKSVSISPCMPTTIPPAAPKTIPDIVLTTPSGQNITLSQKSEPAVPPPKEPMPRPRPPVPKVQKSVPSKKSIRKKESKAGAKKSASKARSVSGGSRGRGRASEAPSYTETETSEEEDDTTESSCFDTKKLNFRYSFEKLKSGKNPKKKRPAFYDVLKKYYRVQKTLDALTKPKGSKGKGRKSIFERILQKHPIKTEPDFVIGKLKKFPFLQYKKKHIFPTEMANFATVSMAEFEERLYQALNDFIVRKEHVVSNINGKSVTTITFTKKSTFDQKNLHY